MHSYSSALKPTAILAGLGFIAESSSTNFNALQVMVDKVFASFVQPDIEPRFSGSCVVTPIQSSISPSLRFQLYVPV